MNDRPTSGPVDRLPGYGPVTERQLAGYLPVEDGGGAYIYFWYIESRAADPSNDPIVIWLNGGPGSSSFLGLFSENGPYKIGDDLQLTDNPYAWNNNAGYLMIDQPAGTGLSVVEDGGTYARTEQEASEQLYRGLQEFYGRWPEFRDRDLYVFGESFAGVYVPMLATNILAGNAAGEPAIRLRGIGVGDGWVDPIVQEATYGKYAYAHGLIGHSEQQEVSARYADCKQAIIDSGPVASREADKICNKIEEYITEVSGGANVYDVRIIGDYDFSTIGRYLDQPDARQALHVAPGVPPWTDTSKRVAYLLELGEQNSAAEFYPPLFGEIDVLIYNGVYDMDCNFMGTDDWLAALQWPERDEFVAAPRTPWILGGDEVAGHVRSVGRLTQVLVAGAGHLVPMDQPARALALFEGFVDGTLTTEA